MLPSLTARRCTILPRVNSLTSPLRPYAGRRVLVGVSGGADSVGLLRALLEVGAGAVAAHLDHALRPESADDAAWVAELCAGSAYRARSAG